jgi:hypothetical protein
MTERTPMDELEILKERFCAHPSRHPSLSWDEVASALDEEKLASLVYMEETGGEPDAFVFEGRLYMADFQLRVAEEKILLL